MMAPDAADPNKPRDLAKIETKVREIEKLRADGRMAQIRNLEQSRQVLTPEQREKLRTLLSERMQHRGPHGPGMRGMAPEDGGQKPAASEETPAPPPARLTTIAGVRSYIPTMSECRDLTRCLRASGRRRLPWCGA